MDIRSHIMAGISQNTYIYFFKSSLTCVFYTNDDAIHKIYKGNCCFSYLQFFFKKLIVLNNLCRLIFYIILKLLNMHFVFFKKKLFFSFFSQINFFPNLCCTYKNLFSIYCSCMCQYTYYCLHFLSLH